MHVVDVEIDDEATVATEFCFLILFLDSAVDTCAVRLVDLARRLAVSAMATQASRLPSERPLVD